MIDARSSLRWLLALTLLGATTVPAGEARADAPAKGTAEAASVSKGSTDVTKEGFEAPAKDKDDKDAKDTTQLSIQAGGASAGGNSRLFAFTVASTFRIRREENQLSAALAANYSRTALPGTDYQTTVENEQAKARYDRFVAKHVSVFLGVQARRDRFQGLDARLQVDPGVAYYFVDEEKTQLWTELGYDYLHDIRRDDAIRDAAGNPVLDADGAPLSKTKSVHSARAFAGYTNALNDAVTFSLGLEYLQAVKDTTFWKLNGDATLASKIAEKFQLATAFSFRYDHAPLPGKQRSDTLISLNLVYTLL